MRKIKFLLATIMMLVGITAQVAAKTVTWNASDIVTVNPWDKSFTKDGITFAPGHADFLDKNFTNGGTFTTASGKFTKIEVTAPYVDISGTGWSGGSWTGDASSSVSYSGDIYDVGMGQLKIVFTIEESVAVTGVTLSQTEATLNIGETLTLTATVAPDNATDQTVTWTSSDETVATVADGVVTAVAVGTATITVTTTDGAKTATCAVTVAATAPEVAWDKDKKTGTFKMPGGNVTLEPEYYPQAALTAAPTAINDVPATTDGAIVKAGTVKNIGETATAQGTLMYYVSPSALDDAALLALAADQWKADVPTAAHLAEGQAYVYYYVRGNDSDTDEENFSDGDILATNALTVTIATEPTYAVTFAEGTDPNEWTADPATGVTKGQTVTVTYTGSKKVIGVKAEKKAAEAPAISFSKQSWIEAESAPANFISVSQADAKAAADAEKTKANAPGYVCIYALEGGQYKWIDSHGRTGQHSSIVDIANASAWNEVYECYNAGDNNSIWFTVEPTN